MDAGHNVWFGFHLTISPSLPYVCCVCKWDFFWLPFNNSLLLATLSRKGQICRVHNSCPLNRFSHLKCGSLQLCQSYITMSFLAASLTNALLAELLHLLMTVLAVVNRMFKTPEIVLLSNPALKFSTTLTLSSLLCSSVFMMLLFHQRPLINL